MPEPKAIGSDRSGAGNASEYAESSQIRLDSEACYSDRVSKLRLLALSYCGQSSGAVAGGTATPCPVAGQSPESDSSPGR